MSRSAKKNIYGIFFLAIFFLIAWGVFRAFVPAPSCTDGVLNQGEEGVDCGGPCAPCAVAGPEALRGRAVQVFGAESGRAVLLARVVNPNADFAADPFSYSFVVHGKEGRVVETTTRKTEVIHASEQEYLFESEVSTPEPSIGDVELTLSGTMWRRASEVPRPQLSASQVVTDAGENGVRVRGVVENGSPFAARTVRVVALLFDQWGVPLFAAQTVVDSVAGGSTQAFPPILFPSDVSLVRAVSPGRTEVFVSGL
jgi:hypothetical protein